MIRTPSGLSRFRVTPPERPSPARSRRRKLSDAAAAGKPRGKGKSPP